jgi:hypothetical protein
MAIRSIWRLSPAATTIPSVGSGSGLAPLLAPHDPCQLHADQQTCTSYTLVFGGDVVVFPRAYDYVYNPLVRAVHRAVFRRIAGLPPVKSLVARLQ